MQVEKAGDELGELKKKEIASKLVQEIAQNSEEIPEVFLKNNVISPAIDASSNLWHETLLIDFSLLSSDSSSSLSAKNELAKLHFAFNNWGCFQVMNHGMSSSFLDELSNIAKQFFALPLEERLKCSITDDDHFNGYADSPPIAGDKKFMNWNDRLFLKLFPEDPRQIQLWPQSPENFREIVREYGLKVNNMVKVILRAMARSLELEDEDSFLKQHNEERSVIGTRIGIYPRCSNPDRVYGVHPHSDGSTITILLQDNDAPEGLHILKDDQWFNVPNVPGALFVNVGDFGEVMSNGIFKSVVHRVVPNSKSARVSVASFCVPDFEGEVEPIKELIGANQPQVYKKLAILNHIDLFLETYPQGKRVLDALRI